MIYIYIGNGYINVVNGIHRLPPISHCQIVVSNGIGKVASDLIQWINFKVLGVGKINWLNVLCKGIFIRMMLSYTCK